MARTEYSRSPASDTGHEPTADDRQWRRTGKAHAVHNWIAGGVAGNQGRSRSVDRLPVG